MIATALLTLVTMTMEPIARPLPLSSVELLPSPFRTSMEANAAYLLRLDPDRLLAGFRANAGLKPKAEKYGGWESMGVAGHTLGHYLTACSLQFGATGDVRFKERVRYLVSELKECQEVRKDGYIGAIPDGDRAWDEVRRGDLRSQGFDLNGIWVPWYTQHKVFAGLIDAHVHVQDPDALAVATRLGEWAIEVTRNLTEAQWQTMLACEHGGMNESLAELYSLTEDRRFLALARKFDHEAVLGPLRRREDKLAGLHSNTQIPKVIGLARLYELEGKESDRTASEFFWDRIVNHRSYAIGGNSNHEHLTHADQLNDHISDSSAETCNTYNMLKLTRHLFGWKPDAKRFDFYERALYNHIQASQNKEDGMLMYFLPLQTGAARNHSTPFESFWCCVGTGIENHAKYGESIYFQGKDRLYVNLFIPSKVRWNDGGMALQMETRFPEDGKVTLKVLETTESEQELAIRRPWWVSGSVSVRVNGQSIRVVPGSDGYLAVKRGWKVGDVLTVDLPMKLTTHPMPDNPKRVALMRGPIVLAALWEDDPELQPIILDQGKPASDWLEPLRGERMKFRSKKGVFLKPLTLIPYADIVKERHTTYFDVLTPAEWKAEQARIRQEAARRREIEKRTLDAFRPGEMQDERDHDFQGEKVQTGENSGRKWRHANDGGWFSIRMKVDPSADHNLLCEYWGGDTGRTFDITIDGEKIAEVRLRSDRPGRFFDAEYAIPRRLTEGKREIVVRFQGHPGSVAGGLYGARVVRRG